LERARCSSRGRASVAITGATGNAGTSVLAALRDEPQVEEIVAIAQFTQMSSGPNWFSTLSAAERLDRSSEEPIACLVEVNAAGEESKQGLPPGELDAFLERGGSHDDGEGQQYRHPEAVAAGRQAHGRPQRIDKSVLAVSEPLVQDGTGRFVVESARGRDVRAEIFQLAAQQRWRLLELRRMGMTLEEVFMRIVAGEETEPETPVEGPVEDG